jgi:hypothetical protein
MCKVYNTVGSLTAVKAHLLAHNINDFKSTKELLDFQKNYPDLRQKIISHHRQVIQFETDNLIEELPQLQNHIDKEKKEFEQLLSVEQGELAAKINRLRFNDANFFLRLIYYTKYLTFKRKLFLLTRRHQEMITSLHISLETKYRTKNDRLNYLTTRLDEAINESAVQQLNELLQKKNIINQINSYIYGAIGEQKIVKELEKLTDEYVLINDFTIEFHPRIYYRQNNDYIKSIQIDHVLLSPSGIFIIETKNWSQESMENLNLHSPVQQIKRTNFALYRLINEKISIINTHHWGDRKIPLRNLIVLIKNKPIEEFQHVKILALNELLSYIKYFQPCLSNKEVQLLSEHLVSINRTAIA